MNSEGRPVGRDALCSDPEAAPILKRVAAPDCAPHGNAGATRATDVREADLDRTKHNSREGYIGGGPATVVVANRRILSI